MPDALIVNASPLIFLGNAGRIDLLRAMDAERIIIPEPVFDEVISGGHTDKAARAVSEAPWLEKRGSPAIPESVVAWDLGPGESSVIATALQIPGAYVVIDDLNGRKCGLALGIGVVGTFRPDHHCSSPRRACGSASRLAGTASGGHVAVRCGHRPRFAHRWNRVVAAVPRTKVLRQGAPRTST